LERFNKKVIGNKYQLTVYEAKLDDAGSYSCILKSTKTSAEVKVLGIHKKNIFFRIKD